MREILFRGKRVGNREWVYGYYFSSDEMPKRGEIGHFIKCGLNEEFQVIPETVGQYTGLRDSKRTEEYPEGQRIFEGDIVHFSIFDHNGSDTQYKGVVKWNNAMFEIWNNPDSEYYGHDGSFVLAWAHAQDDELEIIGNIWDNTEVIVNALLQGRSL